VKKILTILFFTTISFTKNTKAQSGVPDTLAYLQTIVANKAQYIGQPFSVLYNNLQIQIKLFSPFAGKHSRIDDETSTSLAFYFPQTIEDHYLSYPRLDIYWQVPLNINQSEGIWRNSSSGNWSSASYNFYKNAIVSDIKVRE